MNTLVQLSIHSCTVYIILRGNILHNIS